ncbi:MAG TPA: PTS fructose transporter subunit IIA, partial [Caldimonas sp.]|nr:PTS fructose transporter subunit IIA [Caldimonas sp.]
MPGLLIVAHAPLASSLKAVAQHAYPECAARLEALDVAADAAIDEVEAQARTLLERVGTPDVLI